MPDSYGNISVKMIDVACVCVGDQYSPELYVDQLWKSLNLYLTEPFTLTVLTDDPGNSYYHNVPIRRVQVPSWPGISGPGKAWWYKMFLFSEDMEFQNSVLYFDLDVVIFRSINKFTNYAPGKFVILQDFNRKWIRDYWVSNSSIMRWHPSAYYDMWHKFSGDITGNTTKYRGDQDFISAYFRERADKAWWPCEWAMSFKWELYRGGLIQSGTGLAPDGTWPASPSAYEQPEEKWVLPMDCSVAVFHGQPKPWDTEFGQRYML